jgi:hypothetical protein
MRNTACIVCMICVLASILACTPSNAPAPNTAKIAGKVNLDGAPMPDGEARFSVPGQPPKILPIKNGSFEGEVYIGKNRVDVVLEKDGPASSTDAKAPIRINSIAPKELQAEVSKDGVNTFTFEVSSAS